MSLRSLVFASFFAMSAFACAAPGVNSGNDSLANEEAPNTEGKKKPAAEQPDEASSETSKANAAPRLSNINPAVVQQGATGADATITLTGSNFTDSTAVSIDGTTVTGTVTSGTTMTVVVPREKLETARRLDVVVLGPSNARSNAVSLTVDAVEVAIDNLSPTTAERGASNVLLTVRGSNFDRSSTVLFNGTEVATTFVSATQLRATLTSDDLSTAGDVDVVVRRGGASSAPSTFNIKNRSGGGGGGFGICIPPICIQF